MWIIAHFFAQPGRFFEGFVLTGQLDLGNHQAGVVTLENIDFPDMPACRHTIAGFLDNGALTQMRQHEARLLQRHGVFELAAANRHVGALDIEAGALVANAHANRTALRRLQPALQIALPDALRAADLFTPGIVAHGKFSFNFNRHGSTLD